jgi:serine/threonine protein kinase
MAKETTTMETTTKETTTKKTTKRKTTTKKTTKKKRGGAVIESGGFGCVFRPALKCRRPGANREAQGVTKLMKKKYAKSELQEATKFYRLLRNIPNFHDYFLLDGFSVCEPDDLTRSDLVNFEEKCNALKKMGISDRTINEPGELNQLLALNMPYGGIDVSTYIDENLYHPGKMVALNDSLVRLLQNGIVPMNRAGVFHCDLKASNILAREEKNALYTRLIDWGLSTVYKRGQAIPSVLLERPFQYNVPFSNVLFSATFTEMYRDFLSKNPNPDRHSVGRFVTKYVAAWVEERGAGHLKLMNDIFKILFEKEVSGRLHATQYEFILQYIFEYLTNILTKFTSGGQFNEMAYFQEVFLHNIDLWGFIISYVPIVEDIASVHHSGRVGVVEHFKNLMRVLIEADDHKINWNDLVTQLQQMNKSLKRIKSDLEVNESHRTTTSSSSTRKQQQKADSMLEQDDPNSGKPIATIIRTVSRVSAKKTPKIRKRKSKKMTRKSSSHLKFDKIIRKTLKRMAAAS